MCHLISSPTIFFLSPWKRHLLKCTTFHISREEFRPGIWPVCYPQTPHLLDPEVQAQGQCQPLGGWPTPCPTTQGHTGASQQRQFTIPTFYPKVNLLKGINNCLDAAWSVVKFIYSEKATKFCEIFSLLLTVCTVVKSKGKISQNFVAFSEYMNFNPIPYGLFEVLSPAGAPWYLNCGTLKIPKLNFPKQIWS